MSKKNAILLTTLVLAIFSISSAQTDTDSGKGYISLPEGVVLHPHGYGHFEAGQIVSGNLKTMTFQPIITNMALTMYGPKTPLSISGSRFSIKNTCGWFSASIQNCTFRIPNFFRRTGIPKT